ncbi:MATE family efflux transporter [Bacillus sp. FJAT-42376]|uniref:MATE family efflux transporter n=1 Tax=Bacillus sp. FJAT-42376 TaxID=2014076 RepID=UPI000F4DB6FB|nr:MATE family efflux transporter [Bacillus sp. FJAT-42376]AZB43182.1 MATE family efflux transporter [Bacillus sp. FJAT-42376]
MQHQNTLSKKLKQFSTILFPILITQLGLYSMTFLDTTMSGKVSPEDLAGVAVGSSIWVPVYTGLSGIFMAITPMVGQLLGAGKKDRVPFTVFQGLYLSIFMAAAVIAAGFFILNPLLAYLPLEDSVETIARHYLINLSFGILPLFFYGVLRSFIDSLGMTRITMWITLSALPVNFFLNYLFIFGKLGFPALGGAGTGAATALTYWITAIITFSLIIRHPSLASFSLFSRFYKGSPQKWKEILGIGMPIGMAIFFETSIFAAVTLFMSEYNTVTIASHQAAMNFASFLYMIPLSISMGLTIVIGFEAGAKRWQDAKEYSRLGILMGIFLSLLTAAIIFFFRGPIASLYTADPEVLALTKTFLIYAIFFQLSDAVAAPIQGALRGYKDVKFTFFTALISYWAIGLPLGYIMAQYTDLQAFGYWIGLIAGLASGAIGLSMRLRSKQKRLLHSSLELER